MGTFPSLSRSERAPHKITTAVVRAQDQFLSTVDAVVTSPDLPTPSGGLMAGAATGRPCGGLIVAMPGRSNGARAALGSGLKLGFESGTGRTATSATVTLKAAN